MRPPHILRSTARAASVGAVLVIAALIPATGAFCDENDVGRSQVIAQVDDGASTPPSVPPSPAPPAPAPPAAAPPADGAALPQVPAPAQGPATLPSPPSADMSPLPTAIGGTCCCTDLLNAAPTMIGGTFGSGTGNIDFSIPHTHVPTIQTPNAAESLLGRQTIADDSSPMPRDRFFSDYAYFYDVPFQPREETVNRFTEGFEKTFFDGTMSAEVRIPFGTTIDDDFLVKTRVSHGKTLWTYRTHEDTLLGNVVLGAKSLVYRRPDELAVSVGCLVTLPTEDDLAVTGLLSPLHAPSATLRVKNEAVHIAPYVGSLWTPTGNLFLQGFFQLDFDVNGQDVVLENGASSTDLGRYRDQAFAYFDAAIGYWIVRERDVNWAAMFEVHYNASLDNPNTLNVSPGQVNLASGDGNVNLVDLVLGTTLQVQDNKTLTVAYVFAVGAGQDEEFTREWRASFNWCF